MARTLHGDTVLIEQPALDVGLVYEAHADFAWRSLHRLGIPSRDAPDLLQEVFLVVHRRRDEYDPARPLRAWIWGICLGLVRNYRRRSSTWRERLTARLPERSTDRGPERELERRQGRARGQRMLADLEPEKRAVFVMFEVEGMSGQAIADMLDVPLGTVHSRLHAARRQLARALAKEEGR